MVQALLLSALITQSPAPDYAKTWQRVRRSIETRYYARQVRKDEMKRLLDEAEPKATAAKTTEEFHSIVDKMIDSFGDSHFAFLTKDDQGYYMMDGLANDEPAEMPNIGAWFAPGKDGYTVQMVLNGLAAEKAGLRVGDLMLSVDNAPFAPVSSFRGKDGKTVALKVQRDGKVVEATAEVSSEPAISMFLDASHNSSKVLERNGKKIGYFRLWTQTKDSFKRALANAVYGKLANTDGFILDLRDGFGGRPEEFADPFFRPKATLEWKTGPKSGYTQQFGYQKPLVVLINPGTRSAKEILAFILQFSKRATLVGVPTLGQVLGTSPDRINDWSYLEVPVIDVSIEGTRLEKNGVKPNIALKREYDENGNDLVIETALKKLAR